MKGKGQGYKAASTQSAENLTTNYYPSPPSLNEKDTLLEDPKVIESLKRAEEDLKAGRMKDWDEVMNAKAEQDIQDKSPK